MSLDASVVTARRGVVRRFVGVWFDVFVSFIRKVEAVELFWSGGVFVSGCNVWFVRRGVICGMHVLPLGDSS